MGHRLQRAEHGLRQPRRHLGHRRGVLAQPGHRREQVLRRVARQRPGRRRRGRHPHAQPVERRDEEFAEPAPQVARNRVAGSVQGTLRHPHQARGALPRHAGYRVHDSRRQALHAPVPQRQADRHRRLEHGDGHARREADRREDGRHPRGAGPARRTAAPDHQSGVREEGHGVPLRSAGRPRRRVRQDRLHLGRRRRSEEEGRNRHPRPRRNESRGRRRHASGRGHSHRPRRHDQPRGPRRPRLG